MLGWLRYCTEPFSSSALHLRCWCIVIFWIVIVYIV